MPTVIVDGVEIEIGAHERLNGIQAARRAGREIPHYCWHPGLTVVGSCRMCLVEVGSRDPQTGKISMLPKLVPACNTPAKDNTVFVTASEKIAHARAMVEEDLLLRHPIDCPICDKAGECYLQDYHFKYGQDRRRADIRPFTSRRREVGPNVTLFVDRCVMCSRCVRFTREISGTGELMVTNRGAHEEIDVMPGFPLDNKLSGNVVDLCPVGALGDRHFLYSQRVWFMRNSRGVCTRCATGCSIWIDQNQDRIYRVRPRENLEVNKWWICDDGRYDHPHVHDPRRLVQPVHREGKTEALDWTGLPQELHQRLADAGRLGAVLSPFLSVEEAYLLARLVRTLDRDAVLALGPVPRQGEDESFPSGFTISAEKCPNRRGVEAVLAYFSGEVIRWEAFLDRLASWGLRGLWISGGYREAWIDQAQADRLTKIGLVIVQDLFPSPLSERAAYELPGASFAERSASYVNRHDHLQSMRAAIRPPAGVRTEGSLLWEMSGRTGLYSAPAVLAEVAQEIPYFAAALGGPPETGVQLKVNQVAGIGS